MKKTSVIFEVTEEKTTVAVIGSTELLEKFDVTGTEIEKDFIKLLKKLQERELLNKVLDTIDINKWEEVKG